MSLDHEALSKTHPDDIVSLTHLSGDIRTAWPLGEMSVQEFRDLLSPTVTDEMVSRLYDALMESAVEGRFLAPESVRAALEAALRRE